MHGAGEPGSGASSTHIQVSVGAETLSRQLTREQGHRAAEQAGRRRELTREQGQGTAEPGREQAGRRQGAGAGSR